MPWNPTEADRLIAEARHCLDTQGWPSDPVGRRLLRDVIDAVDAAYLSRKLERLRRAATVFQTALKNPAPPAGVTEDHDSAWICRAMERDLGLLPGSLTLWEPIRSSDSQPTAPTDFGKEGPSDGR
jgi:hypothetical protein